jgi:hypothetical protein
VGRLQGQVVDQATDPAESLAVLRVIDGRGKLLAI